MSRKALLPITIEVVGVAAIGVGIGVEVAAHADVGWVVLTSGSALVAIGGVIWGKFMPKRRM